MLQALQAVHRQEVPERFTLLHKGRIKIFAWDEGSHLVTENRRLFVCTHEGRYVLDRTLDELERLLSPRFIRYDRVPVSRDRLAELRRRLGT